MTVDVNYVKKSKGNKTFFKIYYWIILDINVDNWSVSWCSLREEINISLFKKIPGTINWLICGPMWWNVMQQNWSECSAYAAWIACVEIVVEDFPSKQAFHVTFQAGVPAAWLRAHGWSVYKHDPRIPEGSYVTGGKCYIKLTKVTWITAWAQLKQLGRGKYTRAQGKHTLGIWAHCFCSATALQHCKRNSL